MTLKISSLWQSLRAYQIYGANTNVGKTVMSTVLCKAFARKFPAETTSYLKPVSTGPRDEADDRHLSRFSSGTETTCLFQFDEAVSPHIAARSSKPPSDSEVQEQVLRHLASCARSGAGTVLVETAGGVLSPTPSGSSQADLFRPLRLPVCLVADHRLGGISASISAFESLHIRGYDLDLILQFEECKFQNHSYLKAFFEKKDILELSLPLPPPQGQTPELDFDIMSDYYETTSRLDRVDETISKLAEKHASRIKNLEEMSTRAHKQIWYPFTQHRDVSPGSITAIDSASGDFFQTHASCPTSGSKEDGVLTPTFDGSASWWTQGLGHGNPDLSLAAAYAAGRYGHVLFAGTIHEPGLVLAEKLLRDLNNPRLSRVFYSDNGSTGMEVATKMALTASFERYKWDVPKEKVGVLGLRGSYHGDTIGAMDCSEPSTFNEKVHWYRGRGYWFDFPRVKMVRGRWVVDGSEGPEGEFRREEFASLAEIFDIEKRSGSDSGRRYRGYIEKTLERLVRDEGLTFGALIMEPVILGAGGMLFADPLFQHILVQVIRNSSHLFAPSTTLTPQSPNPNPNPTTPTNSWTGLPIIFDEVFTGLYRLGRFSSGSFLQTHPDISVHAKLLTGGLVPLCTTLASESIYAAFIGEEKRDALLHGHSYTAHPVGCHVANTSLGMLRDLEGSEGWQACRDDWRGDAGPGKLVSERSAVPEYASADVWSSWSREFITRISHSREVESVIALGSVLAIRLQDRNAGYSSNVATGLQKKLLDRSVDFKIHVRVLGNVLYMMASQRSKPETLRSIEKFLVEELG